MQARRRAEDYGLASRSASRHAQRRHRRRGELEYIEHHRRTDPAIWKGLAAGLIGGLVGSWTMNQFQTAVAKLESTVQQRNGGQAQPQAAQSQESEPATEKAAEKVSETVLHRRLSPQQKRKLEPVVHYAFGTAMGGLYGVAAEKASVVKKPVGLPFALALFVGADEVAIPKLGLSKPPGEYPLSVHAKALASHIVYGITTEIVRRAARRAL